METLISSLIVAALSGLTFLAYKHPEAFKPIRFILNTLCIAILVGIAIWNSALSSAYSALIPFLSKEVGILEAQKAIETLKVPFGLTSIAYISIILFLTR